MSGRNVYKEDVDLFELPQDAIQEDRGLKSCGSPPKVLASINDVASYKNDRTSFAYKFDSIFIELEDSNGILTDAPGIEVAFPWQSDAVGFIIDWRQVLNGLGALAQGCYRVRINWTKAGNSGWFYKGSYQLLEYTPFNAAGTVRLRVVLNDLVVDHGINYKDSGFSGTVRFEGIFGFMQPNYNTENNILTDKTQHKVSIISKRSYELRTSYLHHCMTRLIDEDTLLAANQIYVSDHNAANHVQYYDFPVIISEEESPNFDYPVGSILAKLTAKFLKKKLNSESKYDGNIAGSQDLIQTLPTTVASCAAGAVTLDGAPLVSVPSGLTVDVELVDQNGATITPLSISGGVIEVAIIKGASSMSLKTGQTISYAAGDDGATQRGRPRKTLPILSGAQQLNFFGSKWAWTGLTGGYFDFDTSQFKDVNGTVTTRSLAFPDFIVVDHRTESGNGDLMFFSLSSSWMGVSSLDFTTAQTTADALSVAGFSDWFVLNINELKDTFWSVDTSLMPPLENTYPNTPSPWVLASNTTDTTNSSQIFTFWIAGVSYGTELLYPKTATNPVVAYIFGRIGNISDL